MAKKKKPVNVRLIMLCELPTIQFNIDLVTSEAKALKIIKSHKKMIDAICKDFDFRDWRKLEDKKTLTVKTEVC